MAEILHLSCVAADLALPKKLNRNHRVGQLSTLFCFFSFNHESIESVIRSLRRRKPKRGLKAILGCESLLKS
jgi:hypothetical protein